MADSAWLKAVKEGRTGLEGVPERFRDMDVCMAAVRQDGSDLEFVPEGLKTAEVCLAAAGSWGGALRFVPRGMEFGREVYEAACRNAGTAALAGVPEAFMTPGLCMLAVEADGAGPDAAARAVLCMPGSFFRQDGGMAFRDDIRAAFAQTEAGRAVIGAADAAQTAFSPEAG